MHSLRRSPGRLALRVRPHQRGQALIYGLFVLAGGLTALFFMFNAGQLVLEKDKLVTTADAVAYSGGVMRARALNFTAYTNRALVANEVAVAQMVSLASWLRYTRQHSVTAAGPLQCDTPKNVPAHHALPRYAVLCSVLAAVQPDTEAAAHWIDGAGATLISLTSVAKLALTASQGFMLGALLVQGHDVLKDVAQVNFRQDGAVNLDPLPLRDDFFTGDGGPALRLQTGAQRQRLADVAVASANRDPFVRNRQWSEEQSVGHPCGTSWRKDRIDRTGSTQLVGLDEWRAADRLRETLYKTGKNWAGLQCKTQQLAFASGHQSAGAQPGPERWGPYQGIPNSLDLSDTLRAYTPDNPDPQKRDLRLLFSIRVKRPLSETRTSEGKSTVQSASDGGAHGLNQFKADAAQGELVAVGTSEVFFERPRPRADGKKELANVFNPYWQVHLVETPGPVMAAARSLQGVY